MAISIGSILCNRLMTRHHSRAISLFETYLHNDSNDYVIILLTRPILEKVIKPEHVTSDPRSRCPPWTWLNTGPCPRISSYSELHPTLTGAVGKGRSRKMISEAGAYFVVDTSILPRLLPATVHEVLTQWMGWHQGDCGPLSGSEN